MKILLACEESQAVTREMRILGHEAYSCDILETSGDNPEWHIQGDVLEQLDKGWDLVIGFPPCTYLTVSANKWLKDQPRRKSGVLVGSERREAREKAIEFFMRIYDSCEKVAVENPIGCMSSRFRKPDQVIQPWMYGHGETKATCLWLKGLEPLKPTKIVEGREQRLHKLPPSKDRAKLRSKTFPGIAKAMSEQWAGKAGFSLGSFLGIGA
jgi:hypothetical protein